MAACPLRPRARYLAAPLRADLARKMVFVAGPRQVGKTTLAFGLPGARAAYLNWDVAAHRDRILRGAGRASTARCWCARTSSRWSASRTWGSWSC